MVTGTLSIGLLDYEKAFDFVNRYHLINDLVDNGADPDLVRNIFNMYSEMFYVPKIDDNSPSEKILLGHLFILQLGYASFFQKSQNHVNLLQLADETVTSVWSLESLAYKIYVYI